MVPSEGARKRGGEISILTVWSLGLWVSGSLVARPLVGCAGGAGGRLCAVMVPSAPPDLLINSSSVKVQTHSRQSGQQDPTKISSSTKQQHPFEAPGFHCDQSTEDTRIAITDLPPLCRRISSHLVEIAHSLPDSLLLHTKNSRRPAFNEHPPRSSSTYHYASLFSREILTWL